MPKTTFLGVIRLIWSVSQAQDSMGREKSWLWEHFHQDKDKVNSTFYGARCSYCTKNKLRVLQGEDEKAVREYLVEAARPTDLLLAEGEYDSGYLFLNANEVMNYFLAKETVKRITGKGPVMVNHLLDCDYCPDNVKKKAQAFKAGKEMDSDPEADHDVDVGTSNANGKRLSGSGGQLRNVKKKQASFTVVTAKAITFSPTKQVEFENMLLRAVISAGWSFNSLNDPEVRKFFAAFIPGAVIPDRRKLSTSILKREVIKVEGSVKEAVKGQYVTLQADGWKDISKKHLLAFMVTANREVQAAFY
jgi:hypothetical protein